DRRQISRNVRHELLDARPYPAEEPSNCLKRSWNLLNHRIEELKDAQEELANRVGRLGDEIDETLEQFSRFLAESILHALPERFEVGCDSAERLFQQLERIAELTTNIKIPHRGRNPLPQLRERRDLPVHFAGFGAEAEKSKNRRAQLGKPFCSRFQEFLD